MVGAKRQTSNRKAAHWITHWVTYMAGGTLAGADQRLLILLVAKAVTSATALVTVSIYKY